MIAVFKTNVNTYIQAVAITQLLTLHLSPERVSFDLEDCDRVLRIVGPVIPHNEVAAILCEQGFECAILD